MQTECLNSVERCCKVPIAKDDSKLFFKANLVYSKTYYNLDFWLKFTLTGFVKRTRQHCSLVLAMTVYTLNDTYNVTDKLFAISKTGKTNQHEIFTIAISFNVTNNHVKMIVTYSIL